MPEDTSANSRTAAGAEADAGPQADAAHTPGSAEHLFSKLTGRGLACQHFPKYRTDDNDPPYPSRLGFFHSTSPNISYLDTSKLCVKCCASVVPDGYNVWSVFATTYLKGTPGTQAAPSPPRWLDISPLPEAYPLAFQAGTERFADAPANTRSKFARDTAPAIAKHIASEPVKIPIPLATNAKEAWRWLQEQQKPFYMDQLHLTQRWSPLAEKRAEIDAAISSKTGVAFDIANMSQPKKSPVTPKSKLGTTKKVKASGSKSNPSSPVELPGDGQKPKEVS
jgi:hypothetical protein